jgi:hypothetical protein
MSAKKRNEEYFFRIVGLSKDLCEVFEKRLKVSGFEKKLLLGTKKYVVAFPLKQNKYLKKIENFLFEERISDSKYGIFVTLTTNKDIDGIEFPNFISNFHKHVGGNIDVSLIFTKNETCTES